MLTAASQAQAPLTSEAAKRPSESHRKRRPAATRTLGVRVVENEPFAHEARVVVERRPVDEPEALGIDEDPRAFRAFEHVVAVLRGRLPVEDVAQTRTPARLDADAEAALREPVTG